MSTIEALLQYLDSDIALDSTAEEDKVHTWVLILNNVRDVSADDRETLMRVLRRVSQILLQTPHSDTSATLIDLLVSVVRKFSFGELEAFYLPQYIIDVALEASPGTSLVFQIVAEKNSDPYTIRFLTSTDFLLNAVRTYFSVLTTLLVVSSFENLLKLVVNRDQILQLLTTSQFTQIYERVRRDFSPILVPRLVDFVAMVAPYTIADGKLALPSSVYTFSAPDFTLDDPLLVILLIASYRQLVGVNLSVAVQHNICTSLNAIFELWNERATNADVETFYATEIANLMCAMSYSELPAVRELMHQWQLRHGLFKSYNLYLDSSDADVELVSGFNPNLFLQQTEIIENLVSYVPLYSKRYFPILLNLVASSYTFDMLVTLHKLDVATISRLSFDLLFRLLLQMSKYKHSSTWLLLQSQLMNEFVLGKPISEHDIWKLKRDTLRQLVDAGDLGVWHDSVRDLYKVMCNGRDVRNVVPIAEVADATH